MKFIVVKCRLRHNTQFFSLFRRELSGLFLRFNHYRRSHRPAHDPFHLRVSCVSDDDDFLSFRAFLLHDSVDPLHKRTGGIDAGEALLFNLFLNPLRHAVRADDHRPLCKRVQGSFRFQHPDTSVFQILHHNLIVNDRPVGVDGFCGAAFCRRFDLLIYLIHGALHSKTEARALCKNYFHIICSLSACRWKAPLPPPGQWSYPKYPDAPRPPLPEAEKSPGFCHPRPV